MNLLRTGDAFCWNIVGTLVRGKLRISSAALLPLRIQLDRGSIQSDWLLRAGQLLYSPRGSPTRTINGTTPKRIYNGSRSYNTDFALERAPSLSKLRVEVRIAALSIAQLPTPVRSAERGTTLPTT